MSDPTPLPAAADQYTLEREQFIPRRLEEVFAFFGDGRNLQAITPDFVDFRIITAGPLEIRTGAIIDYRLRLFGIPLAWRSRIEDFEPLVGFTDVQLSGPYRRWHHRHEFQAVDGGTRMTDRVDYAIGYGPLGRLAHALFVRPTLAKIFAYRRQRIAELLGDSAAG
ncbi:MAG TPA: SRPBCC family protein [Pirellulales bacterium]|nr:SRPBCC family protein [Pirellulales bacterium]